MQPPSIALNSYCRTKYVSNMKLCPHFSGDFIDQLSRKSFFHAKSIEKLLWLATGRVRSLGHVLIYLIEMQSQHAFLFEKN